MIDYSFIKWLFISCAVYVASMILWYVNEAANLLAVFLRLGRSEYEAGKLASSHNFQ
jgi:hypothetical protein